MSLILSLDFGRSTGWAHETPSGEIKSGQHKDKAKEIGELYHNFHKWLKDFCYTNQITHIFYEDNPKQIASIAWHRFGGYEAITHVVARSARMTSVAVNSATTTRIRSYVLGSGNASKTEARAMLKNIYKVSFEEKDHDEADAYIGLLYYRKLLEKENKTPQLVGWL